MEEQSERTTVCTRCGHFVRSGRFCTNCGVPLDPVPAGPRAWPAATDTAERRYDVLASPEPPEAAGAHSWSAAPAASPPPPVVPPTRPPSAPSSHVRPGPGAGLWVGVGIAMLAVLLLGGFLLFHGSGSGTTASTSSAPLVPKHTSASARTETTSSPTPSTPPPSPTGRAANVAGLSEATAPAHAPAGVDFTGSPVTYVAPNMVDGVTDTCWRVAGDATGMVLTFRLDQPTRLTRVGLINGYAKIAYDGGRRYDWYRGNRRVLGVDWVFDDGTTVSQTFGSSRTLQQIAIKPVTAQVVRLRITAVSPPGTGRAARNDTAISEVLLLGRTT